MFLTFESSLDMSFRIPNYVYNVLFRLLERSLTLIKLLYLLYMLSLNYVNFLVNFLMYQYRIKNRFFNFFND